MSEELMIREASPTLAGIKTGSLFNCAFDSREEMLEDVRSLNRSLLEKGLCMLPLRFTEGRALLYLFRAAFLRRDLADAESRRLLREAGYRRAEFPYCLTELCKRLNSCSEFPHEIGLFLGYPPEDVRGFIENGARGSLLTGCWKVYWDVDAARKRFAEFKRCTEDYSRQHACGRSVLQLAVRI